MDQEFTVERSHIPSFSNHEEAREWFKEQFGDRFLLRMTDMIIAVISSHLCGVLSHILRIKEPPIAE